MSDYSFWTAEEWEAWIANQCMECAWQPEKFMCPMCKANLVIDEANGVVDWVETCENCGSFVVSGCLIYYYYDSEKLYGAWQKLEELNVI